MLFIYLLNINKIYLAVKGENISLLAGCDKKNKELFVNLAHLKVVCLVVIS